MKIPICDKKTNEIGKIFIVLCLVKSTNYNLGQMDYVEEFKKK